MNDENFDKIFGDKLKEGKDFAFTEAKWQEMERQLAAFKKDQRWRRMGLWLVLPLFILSGLLGWSTWALQKTQNDIQTLAQELKTLGQRKQLIIKQQSEKSDTIYHHIIVKRYDTIFQTLVVREELSGGVADKQDVLTVVKKGNADTAFSKVILKPDKRIANTDQKIETTPPQVTGKPLIVPNENVLKDVPKMPISPKSLDLTDYDKIVLEENEILKDSIIFKIAVPSDTLKAKGDQKADSIKTKSPFNIKIDPSIEAEDTIAEKLLDLQGIKRPPLIKPIHISGCDIGVSGGLAIIDNQNVLRQEGQSIGVRGGILLGERFKIVGEAQYLALSYETNKLTGNLDIPIITAPSTDDEFKEVRVKQPYFYSSLGLQYVLTRTKLKPYVGASALALSKLEEKFEYQFENKLTKEDVLVSTRRNEASFKLPFLRLQTGFEYPIFKKIKAHLEGSYDVNLGNSLRFKPLTQIKVGILYRFRS